MSSLRWIFLNDWGEMNLTRNRPAFCEQKELCRSLCSSFPRHVIGTSFRQRTTPRVLIVEATTLGAVPDRSGCGRSGAHFTPNLFKLLAWTPIGSSKVMCWKLNAMSACEWATTTLAKMSPLPSWTMMCMPLSEMSAKDLPTSFTCSLHVKITVSPFWNAPTNSTVLPPVAIVVKAFASVSRLRSGDYLEKHIIPRIT